MSTSPHPNELLARRWFQEVWNERNSATIYELLSPEAQGHLESAEVKGPDQFFEVWKSLVATMPDLRLHVHDVLASETDAVVRWHFEGTPVRRAERGDAASARISYSGITWFKCRDGRIIEGWDRWNYAGMMMALI